jgi:hypothetical protein
MTEHEQRVLRKALELVSFSLPQLAMYSGASYEVVREIVEREAGETIERSDIDTADVLAPGAEVWVVTGARALEERLGESAAEGAPAPRIRVESPLAAAEDDLLFALASEHPEDAFALARDALARLEGTPLAADSRREPEAASAPLVTKRNLKAESARAWAVRALAEYLMSDETAALMGSKWRHAFRSLAAVDLPDQAALQKRLVVELVRIADERAAILRGARGLPALVEILARSESIRALLQSGGPIVREPVKAALVELMDEIRRGERSVEDDATAMLCEVAGELFREDAEPPAALVQALRSLAYRPEEKTARSAQEALLVLVQPRDVKFWRTLARAERPAPLRLIFAALSRFDLDAAFDLLDDVIRHDDALDDVQAALVAVLGELEAYGSYLVQDAFASFLAELPPNQRSVLMQVPAQAGLTWSAFSLDRPLAQRFFSALTAWKSQLGAPAPDPQIQRQRDRAGKRLQEIASEALLVLGSGQRRRAREELRGTIGSTAGAAVAVPVLLAAGWEEDVARALAELSRYEDDASAWVARWYFEVCPQSGMTPEQLAALMVAMYQAVQRDERFLRLVARRAAEKQFDLSELFDNAGIDPWIVVRVQSDNYGDTRPGLMEIAEIGTRRAECIRS